MIDRSHDMWTHNEAVRTVRESRTLSWKTYERGFLCSRYYHGRQWTDDELRELVRRGQPVQTLNRVKKKVNVYMGLEQKHRSDPKAYATSPNMKRAALGATKILRHNAEKNRFDRTKSLVFRDLLTYGTGAVCQTVKKNKRGKYQTQIKRIRFGDLIFDPASYELDFSDAAFMGYGRYISLTQLQRMYPDKAEEFTHEGFKDALGMDYFDDGESADAQEAQQYWYNAKARKAFVIHLYYKVGDEWYFTIFTARNELEHRASPFQDQDGNSMCGITAQSCYIDDDLLRYGVVYDMISAQDGINKRRSKMLNLLTTSKLYIKEGAVEDVNKFREQFDREDGTPVGRGEWGTDIIDIGKEADVAGHAALLQQDIMELDGQGANPGLTGRNVNGQSGRAIQSQQQAGLIEENEPFDALREWEVTCYRRDFAMTRTHYTDQRVIRIAGDDEAAQFLTLNEPAIHPVTGQQITRNSPAMMDVDILLKTGPDKVTLRHEQMENMMELAKIYGPDAIPIEVFMALSDIDSDTQRLFDEAKTGGSDPQKQAAMLQQQALAQRGAAAQIAAAEAEAAEKASRAQLNQAKAAEAQASMQETQAETRGVHGDQRLALQELVLKARAQAHAERQPVQVAAA